MTNMVVQPRTLAEFMTYLAENRKEYGCIICQTMQPEDVQRYDFAVEILKDTDVEVKPVDSGQFPSGETPITRRWALAKQSSRICLT